MEKSSLVMSLQPFFIQTHSVYLWHGVWQELFLPKTEILHRMRQVLRLLIHKNRWSQYYSSYFLIYRTCITIIHNRYRFLPLAPKSYSTLFAQMLTHIVLYHMPVWIGGVNSSIDAILLESLSKWVFVHSEELWTHSQPELWWLWREWLLLLSNSWECIHYPVDVT